MKKHGRCQGSMTVEMAILFPVIFFTILGMLYLCIIKYQNIAAGTAAMRAAARGAACWDKLGGDGAWDFQTLEGEESGGGLLVAANYSEHDPYRYILDTKSEKRLANIQAYARWLVEGNPSVMGEDAGSKEPVVTKTGNILQKYVTVSITKRYTNPFEDVMAQVGLSAPDEAVITASAPLNTPAEFIRNASFIYDLVKGDGYKGG